MRSLVLMLALLGLWSSTALAQTERELLQALKQSAEGRQRIKAGCADNIRPIAEWRLADLDLDGSAEVIAPWSTEGPSKMITVRLAFAKGKLRELP